MSGTKRNSESNKPEARLIAFYLPQFHPIPENDKWWGKGFTEWTNVAKAKPLFRGHHQPNVPADLGFYDLRVPETRQAQADLAREHGIEGFCYWHYWFGNGRRILERPIQEVLESGSPDFPFCLGWANESWTGIWHGASDNILMEQKYPGRGDDAAHFQCLLEAFSDPRYIRIEDKPVFVVYRPEGLPDPKRFTGEWNELAVKAGLKGIYFVGVFGNIVAKPEEFGFDGLTGHVPGIVFRQLPLYPQPALKRLFRGKGRPKTYSYENYIQTAQKMFLENPEAFPCVLPNWDNTPRSGENGRVLLGSNPDLFSRHLKDALEIVRGKAPEKRIVFIKSWNEWAEGNYLEPDQRFGLEYLQKIRSIVL